MLARNEEIVVTCTLFRILCTFVDNGEETETLRKRRKISKEGNKVQIGTERKAKKAPAKRTCM